ncbi:MAG TPA: hypothetical protein VK324_09950, partial [Tepidisphaeraceae bacterium]|nr:hypothetical protein [Tepidisphaeraceae bacterium]
TKAGAATAAPAAPALGATSPVEAGTKNGEATDAADPLQTLDAELSAALVADADPEPVHAEAVDSLPVYLKPLEWLNAPFAGLSDALREAVGKVAIVTLVNAFAVLAYVVVFRGR